MTPDDMKTVAGECEALARDLAPLQDAGLFAPAALEWTGIAEADGGRVPVDFQAVRSKDGKVEGVLMLNGKPYIVAASLKDDRRKPVVPPKVVHRVVNATLSAANTFHHLLAGGDKPLPPDSTFDPKGPQWTPPSASPPT